LDAKIVENWRLSRASLGKLVLAADCAPARSLKSKKWQLF